MELSFLAATALGLRITLLGLERIFLKKLDRYDSVVIASLFFLLAAVFLTPIFFIIHDPILVLIYHALPALISSLFYAIGFFLYVRAIALEDTSLIAPLYNSSLFWIMILGATILGEKVTYIRVSGGVFIFIGVFLLYGGSITEKIQAIRNSRGSILMLIGSIFLAVGRTIDAAAVQTVDPSFYAFAINLTVGIYLFLFSVTTGRTADIFKSLREEPKNLVFAGITNGWSYLFLLVALQSIDLSIAEPLSLLSIFVTAGFAKIIFDEQVIKRIPAMFVILFGAILLFF